MSHTEQALNRITLCVMMLASLLGCGGGEEKTLRQAAELIDTQMYLEAINLLDKLIASNDRNVRARELLADAHEALGNYPEAIDQLKKAEALYAAQPEQRSLVRLRLAQLHLRLGDRRSAFSLLRAIVHTSPNNSTLNQIASLVADAYEVVQLTSGDKDNYAPRFSPDGSRIVFSSARLDNGELYLMDTDGRLRQRVTFTTDFNEDAASFVDTPPSVPPYKGGIKGAGPYKGAIEGGGLHLIYSREPKASREVKIVLQSSGSTPIYAGIYATHIFSKVTQEILPVAFGVRAPSVSPDGRRVVYESNSAGNLELYVIELGDVDTDTIDTSAITPKRITYNEVDDGSPVFFPDGQRLVFVSARGDATDPDRKIHQLYTIGLDGSNETPLNPNPYDCYTPAVSPDGKTIAFASSREGDMEIYMMDADGTNERRITNGIGASIQPAFSPDGTKLAFVSDRSDSFQIYLMPLDKPITREALMRQLESE